MRILVPTLLAATILAAGPGAQAAGPRTIPAAIAKQLVKGKRLDRVWMSPDFDSTKGIVMGPVKNETEEDGKSVQDYFPLEIGRLVRKDSPYVLEISITGLRFSTSPTHNAFKVDLEVEGRIRDGAKNIVAAFATHGSSSNGGNLDDCARIVVRAIIFDLNKDLFPATTPQSLTKRSEVIVPAPEATAQAPAPAAKDTSVIVPAPLPAPLPAAPAEAPAAQPAPAPKPAAPAVQPKPAPAPQPKAAPAPKPALAPLFSPEITARMQKGKTLDRVWISQFYDRTRGFALGEVRYATENRNDGVDQYLPEALKDISRDDAPVVLNLRIVDLQTRALGQNGTMVRLGVEGNLVAKDGTVVAAFTTATNLSGTLDLVETCRNASRQIILDLTRELQ